MKTIPLTRGLEAIVDDEDFARVDARSWQARPALSKSGRQIGWYVQRRDLTVWLSTENTIEEPKRAPAKESV